jgi:hypothetical protein
MASIVIDDDQAGEDRLFNLRVKLYLQENSGLESKSISNFRQCINSPTTKMYLASLNDDSCEIIAFNKDGKERYFKLDTDPNMHIKGIKQIKTEEGLSNEGKMVLDFHRDGGSPTSSLKA